MVADAPIAMLHSNIYSNNTEAGTSIQRSITFIENILKRIYKMNGYYAKRLYELYVLHSYFMTRPYTHCLVVDLKFPDPISIKGYHIRIYIRVFHIRNSRNFHSHSFAVAKKKERRKTKIRFFSTLHSIGIVCSLASSILHAARNPSRLYFCVEKCIHLMQWLHLNNTNMAKCSSVERH